MKKETVQKEVYIADDGQEFDNEMDCEIYETKMNVLNELKDVKLMDKNFYTLFIKEALLKEAKEKINKVFKTKNPDIVREGWNLLYDGGKDSICFPIEDIMKTFTEPVKREPEAPVKRELTEDEILSVKTLKKELMGIVNRHTSMQGSPEGKFGSLLLELDTLIKKW